MIYVFVVCSSFLISLFKNKKNSKFIVYILVVFLGLFAGTRIVGIDNDSNFYKYLFEDIVYRNEKWELEFLSSLIPVILSWFTQSYVQWSFVAFALISLSLKFISIKDFKYFSLAILLYSTNLFFLQDFTTIRAAIASGILLYSIRYLYPMDNKRFFMCVVMSTLFHLSSIIFITIWLVLRYRISLKVLFYSLLLSLIIPLINLNLIILLRLDLVFSKAASYLIIQEQEDSTLNLFSFKILIALVMLFILIRFRDLIKYKYFDILLKIHMLSLIFFFVFSGTGLTFSIRTFELLSIVQILLYPLIINVFPQRLSLIPYLLIFGISFICLYYNIFFSDTIKDYQSWLI
ncbi:EpsG family protein [Myroides odoratimimus]|uniref:EpsG family protein n=1 Tax=Myroides odoratimimus TaxID=76832 RepID=UPI001040DF03|nr:EpsG family protein [Myroides odoratimimus]QBK77617.1 EpsG family protein [Myroides odoratimimus]WHT73064.1 EpsG family protein [Myroides odoratimimus]WHU37647.1 EpsG family protein [Myroides odoratimimus]